MSLGTRFRPSPEATSRKTTFGAALVGLALLGGTVGGAVAQEASPAASPEASPVVVAAWIEEIQVEADVELDGDSTTVGVAIGEVLEINSATFETRPVVQLQLNNTTDSPIVAVLLTAPAEFDTAGFTLPDDPADLPEGVTPYASAPVPAGTQVTAVLPNLPEGTYILATTSDLAITFVVTPAAAVDVPDIFATPAN